MRPRHGTTRRAPPVSRIWPSTGINSAPPGNATASGRCSWTSFPTAATKLSLTATTASSASNTAIPNEAAAISAPNAAAAPAPGSASSLASSRLRRSSRIVVTEQAMARGQPEQLDDRVDAQLGHDVLAVGLGGAYRDEQRRGDPFVAPAADEQREHLALARRQLLERARHGAFDQRLDLLARQARRQVAPAGRDRVDRGKNLVGLLRLERVPGGASAQHLGDGVRRLDHREHEDPARRL